MARYYFNQPDVISQLERALGVGKELALTAHAGGGQASATQLSGTVLRHRFTTVASPNDSAQMPPATSDQVGLRHSVKNSTLNPMQLFGNGTDTIDDVLFSTGITVAAGQGLTLECYDVGLWYVVT